MATITRTESNLNVTAYSETNTQTQTPPPDTTTAAATQQISVETTSVTLQDGLAVKNGLINTTTETQLVARADNKSQIDNTINNITGRPVDAALSELTSALQNKPASYQADLINRLVQRDPEAASRILGAAGNANNRTIAGAFSHAYNAQGQNGDSFLYNIIKNGIGTNMISAGSRGYGVGNLAAISGNQNMMREFAEKALVYGHQLRDGGTPQGQQIASALVNSALQAAGGNGTVLNSILGRINSADINDAVQSGNPAIGRALDTAARNGFGTNLFLSVADKSGQASSTVKDSLVNYFNTMSTQVLNRLTDGAAGRSNADKLANFFNTVVSNSNYAQKVLGGGGGLEKALNSALDRYNADPITAGIGAGRLLGALHNGFENFKASDDRLKEFANFLGDTAGGTIPFGIDLGPSGAKLTETLVGKINEGKINTAQDLIKELHSSIVDLADQRRAQLYNQGNRAESSRIERDFIHTLQTRFSEITR